LETDSRVGRRACVVSRDGDAAGQLVIGVPDCVKDPNLGLGQEECGQLREWLASLLRSVTSESMLTMEAAVGTQAVANVLRRVAEKRDDGSERPTDKEETGKEQSVTDCNHVWFCDQSVSDRRPYPQGDQ
jgi:hypothetical protein